MRAAIAAAVVGDEQKREDPTVNELEERAARAARTGRGDLPPDGDDGEPDRAAPAHRARRRARRRGELPRLHLRARRPGRSLGRRHPRRCRASAGRFSAEQVRAAYRVPAIHSPRTRVLWIENTHNASGGRIWPLEEIDELHAVAHELDLRFHLDGARLLNAAVATGVDAAEIGGRFDTVTLCLSKGLGCPLGAILAGQSEVMGNARRLKHLFGGAMRQAGIVAAAGVYALDHHIDRLADDHRAREAARARAGRGRARGRSRPHRDELRPDRRRAADEGRTRSRSCAEQGVGLSATIHPTVLRAVTHLDVTDEDIDGALRGDPESARSSCRRLSLCARTLSAEARGRAGRAANAVRRARRSSAAASSSGSRRSASPTSRRATAATRGHAVPDRLDHEDLHGGRRSCSCATRASSRSTTADDATCPRARTGRRSGRMLAHSSGLQREPPGEIWETMQAPTREELLAGTADAEQVLDPGSLVALLQPRVRAARRGRRPRARRHLGGGAAGERVLDPLGLARTTPAAADPAARGYFVEPYSDAVRLEPDPDLGGAGALGKLWSTTGDLARWGAFLAAGDDRVLEGVDARGDGARPRDGRPRGLEARVGARDSSSTARGDHVFVGHGGAMPGHLAGLVVNRKTKIGAAVLTNTGAGASPEKLALDLAVAAIEALPAAPEAWQPGEARAAGDRAAARPLVGRGLRDRVLVAERPARGEARRRPSGARHLDLRARRRGSLPQRRGPRARRAAARRAGRATARSRSCTSRRIRYAASRRRSSARRRRRRRPRCRT